MKKFKFLTVSGYKNAGQSVEQSIRFHFFGSMIKADNKQAHDIEIDGIRYQIKSPHATIGHCPTVAECVTAEPSDGYIMSFENIGFIMSKSEFQEFAESFSEMDRESSKNGGKAKIRLKRCKEKMLEWLTDRA